MSDAPPPPFDPGSGRIPPAPSPGRATGASRRGLRRLARALRGVRGRVGHGLSHALAQEAAWAPDAAALTTLTPMGVDWVTWSEADSQMLLEELLDTQPAHAPQQSPSGGRQISWSATRGATLQAYSSWRRESGLVQQAYRAWVSAPYSDLCSAFEAYRATLDREQHAAETYAAALAEHPAMALNATR